LEKAMYRMTMGGGPLCVVDDMDRAEWNTAAMVNQKRILSPIIFRLREQFVQRMLHYGQQMDPGEPLPLALRPVLAQRGYPVWKNIASPTTKATHQYTTTMAALVATELARPAVSAYMCSPLTKTFILIYWTEAGPPTSIRCRPI